jgi:hypothetical protein
MPKIALVGPSAVGRSSDSDPRRALNLYPHKAQGGKHEWNWIGTPGTSLNKALAGVARGFHVWNSTAYVVVGNALYTYDGTTLAACTGATLTTSTGNVSMENSRTQLVITDGSANIYVWDGTTFTTVSDFSEYTTLNATSTIVVAHRVVQTEGANTVIVASGVATVLTTGDHLAYPGDKVEMGSHGTATLNGDFTIIATPTTSSFTIAVTTADGTYNDADYTETFHTATANVPASMTTTAGDKVVIAGMSDTYFNTEFTINETQTATHFTFNVDKATATYTSIGAEAWIRTTSLPITPDRVAFMDGYFIFNNSRTSVADGVHPGQVYYSALDDARNLRASRLFVAQRDPDAMLSPFADRGNLFLLGEKSVEVWFNPGSSSTDPFEPARGAAIPWGILGAWTVARMDNGLMWLGSQDNGSPCIIHMAGYDPAVVSTPAVEYALKGAYSSLSSATAYSYRDEGHEFYVLSFGTQTWVYDSETKTWHERSTASGAHCGKWYGYLGGKHLVTDRTYSTILEMNLNTPTDWVNGVAVAINRIGQSGSVQADDASIIHRRIHLDIENPTASAFVTLSWSDDGGHTWAVGRMKSTQGYGRTVEWFRLGRAPVSRIYRFTFDSKQKVFVLGAYLDADGG